MIRSIAFALGALLFTATDVRADDVDEEVCISWLHVFIDDGPEDSKTIKSEATCVRRARSLDDHSGEPFEDGTPYREHTPEASVEMECKYLDARLAELRRSEQQAYELLPGAIYDRDKALGDARDEWGVYEKARAEWQRAKAALEQAKRDYEAANGSDPEIERDDRGRIVRVAREYDPEKPFGQAIVDAMQKEREAAEAMDKAWDAWTKAGGGTAQAAQLRVDHYRSVIALYPEEYARALEARAALGCK